MLLITKDATGSNEDPCAAAKTRYGQINKHVCLFVKGWGYMKVWGGGHLNSAYNKPLLKYYLMVPYIYLINNYPVGSNGKASA